MCLALQESSEWKQQPLDQAAEVCCLRVHTSQLWQDLPMTVGIYDVMLLVSEPDQLHVDLLHTSWKHP